jgi:hypothetical protein
MNKKLKLEELTQIEKRATYQETYIEPKIEPVEILEENTITDTYTVFDIDVFETLTSGVNFQSLQYR